MKKLLALLVLISLGLTIVGCGGGAAETAEEVVNATLEAMKTSDREAFMALVYPGNAFGGSNMQWFEEFWAELEEYDIEILSWSEPITTETMYDSEAEGDIIDGALLESDVIISFDGVPETEDIKFIVVKTAEGWYVIEIDS